MWTRFLSALDPLVEAGKLGALLFQFPPWFTIRRATSSTCWRWPGAARPLRVAVEFRHESWFDGDNQQETLDFLREHELPYVCVDMPQGHRSSVPPVLAATADLAVVRFHGHSDEWTSKDIYEKFGYLYSEPELRDWAPRLRDAGRPGRADPRAHEQLLPGLRPAQRRSTRRHARPTGPRRTHPLSAAVTHNTPLSVGPVSIPGRPARRVGEAGAAQHREGEREMRVMVFVKASRDSEAGVMPSEEIITAMGKYNEELVKAGVLLDGDGLRPSSHGARVRFSGTGRTVIDGPFAETKELVAGYWLWQVKLDGGGHRVGETDAQPDR